MLPLLDHIWLGNTLSQWLTALGVAAGAVVLLLLIRRVVVSRFKRFAEHTSNDWDDMIAEVLVATHGFPLTIIGILIGVSTLEVSPAIREVMAKVGILAVLLQAGFWLAAALTKLLNHYQKQRIDDDQGVTAMMGVLNFLVRTIVWSGVVLLALDNFGVDVTALVTGLGVGGIAVGLALQNILGDLFASLAIVFDKPFQIGDFIAVDELVGTVEYIGLKSTRIRSLGGEQLVFGNTDLLKSRIHNYGRMFERRIVFTIGATYETPRASLIKVPGIIKAAIEANENSRFDRSHLAAYGASSIDFETVWYVTSSDYSTYMDIQQAVYLAIHEAFENEGIEFAYPTRTVHLVRD